MQTASPLDTFKRHRPRLLALAWRMLGSRADAEDAVQDAWLRWQGADAAALVSAEAWLVRVTTRLCIDRLRAARLARAHYPGPWLPEPVIEPVSPTRTPEQAAELAGEVSMAFLTVLECLSPEERAAFLLREVFDRDYDEVAELLARTEAACRQLVHRARARLREARPRVTVTREAHQALLQRFIEASHSHDRAALGRLLDADAQFVGDGGGKVLSTLRPLHGAERLLRFFDALARNLGDRLAYRQVLVNGEPGLLRYLDGQADAVLCIDTDGEHIHAFYVVRNPDKLTGLPPALRRLDPVGAVTNPGAASS